ncbi:hypothetical protein JCM11641_005517 [Rhodosporidiobolus odoratus]
MNTEAHPQSTALDHSRQQPASACASTSRIPLEAASASLDPATAGRHGDSSTDSLGPKKPRLPRIAEACIRARRKNAKRSPHAVATSESTSGAQAPSAPAFVSAPSPSSLSNILREQPASYSGTTTALPPFAGGNGFFPYATHPYPTAPSYHPNAPPLVYNVAHNPHMPIHRPPFPIPPPPPPAHAPYRPPSQHTSPNLGSPSLNLSAPISAMRSDSFSQGDSAPAASVSPASAGAAVLGNQATASHARRATAEGEAVQTPSVMRQSDTSPLPIKGDGDAMQYDEDEEEDEDEDDSAGEWHEKAARGVAFLSLIANGNPTYVGPSSGFSWARMILAGISGAAAAEGGKYTNKPTHWETSQPLHQLNLSKQSLSDDALESIPAELAEMILVQTYRHMQPRYPFIDWLYLHQIWGHRNVITQRATQPNASKVLKTAAFFIWMVFAVGCRFCHKLAIPNLASPEAYYSKAMEHLETIVGLHDLKNVQALMLMVMFSFRSPEAPSIWYLVGIIVRLCCSLGLHRKIPPVQARRTSPYILQLRKRIFYTAYTLDRMMAMSLGRSVSIPDHDIDIELPLDYDCVTANPDLDNPPAGPTSMTSSLHFFKLMLIESIIQKQAYRVDRPNDRDPRPLLRMIDDWVAAIPAIASEPTCWTVPCCSQDWFLARAADARMYLLRPRTAEAATADPELVKLIAKYAADACEVQKRIHQSPASTLSLEGLRSVFLCGLTLLHAVQLDRDAISLTTLQRAVRSNSNTMFAYAGAYKGAAAYGEVFDELANAVLDKLTRAGEPEGPIVPPANLQSAATTPLFQSLWEDIPSVMTNNAQESFNTLLESLGVSSDAYVPTTGAYSDTANLTMADLGLSDVGTFAPTSGLEFEPFALGSSAGGLW